MHNDNLIHSAVIWTVHDFSCACARVGKLDKRWPGKTFHNPVQSNFALRGKGAFMRPTRDFCQRKIYGLIRVSLAIIRLGKAETKAEREKASDWVVAWMSFGGIRRCKANQMRNKED